jgi:hypothetical protein
MLGNKLREDRDCNSFSEYSKEWVDAGQLASLCRTRFHSPFVVFPLRELPVFLPSGA